MQASPTGHAAPLQVDISLPFKVHGRREAPAEQLPLQRLPDGSVQIRHERQRADTGVLAQPPKALHQDNAWTWVAYNFLKPTPPIAQVQRTIMYLHRASPFIFCAGLDMQHRLDGISRLLHREQHKLLWASLRRALEAEAAQTEGDAAHALVQKMVFCAASEAPGTQELAAMLLDMYLEAVEAGRSKARGECYTCLTRPRQTRQ